MRSARSATTTSCIHGQRMHHGVAIVSRVPLVEDDRLDWQANREARHVGVRLPNGMRLENVYVPAGGDVPDREVNPKFGQKLDFVERMTRWSEALDQPTLLVGDFNIAPLPSDVWSHKAAARRRQPYADRGRGARPAAGVDTAGSISAATSIPAPARLHTWWSYRAQGLGGVRPRPAARPSLGDRRRGGDRDRAHGVRGLPQLAETRPTMCRS